MGWYEFLPKLLNMSMTASLVILVVLLVRLLLGKAPKVFSYALWSVVLFRLLCPVAISSEVSLLRVFQVPVEDGAVEYIPTDIVHMENPGVTLPGLGNWSGEVPDVVPGMVGGAGLTGAQKETMAGLSGSLQAGVADTSGAPVTTQKLDADSTAGQGAATTDTGLSPFKKLQSAINSGLPQGSEQLGADPLELPITVGTYIWGLGALVLLIYNMVQLHRLREKLQVAESLGENIYLADYIDTPFVMGLLHPRIYLPSNLKEQERSYIIMHEQYHIRRYDHVVKVLAFAALCIHWFNPLVWIAFVLANKDMEMSCDEAVLRQMETDIRAEYAGSLLQLATGKRLIAGAPLAFGEGDTKSRVKNVMHYRKPTFWLVLLTLAVCAVVAVGLMTNPKEEIRLVLPGGATYQCADIAYNATWNADFNYFLHNPDSARGTQYYLSLDMNLYGKGQLTPSFHATSWISMGRFEEVTLTRKNFDAYFHSSASIQDSQEKINKSMNAASVRRQVARAWQLMTQEDVYQPNYYLLQLENGGLGLVAWESDGDKGVIKWMIDLEVAEPEPVDVQVGTTYCSKDCLYMNPLSSYAAIGGDSGSYYRIEENAFVEISKRDGSESSLQVDWWAWQEFPYTDEEWAALYFPGFGREEGLSKYYEEILYQPISKRKFLLRLDGQLWLVQVNNDPKAGIYLWSIYSLMEANPQELQEIAKPIVEQELPVVGETYRSSECLCISHFAPTWLLDGDSGYFYRIEKDDLIMVNKADGSETPLPVEKWEWQELPYTDEEWKLVAENSPYLKDIRSRFQRIQYQPIGESHFLLKLNDMLVFAEYIDFRLEEHGAYMGNAYTLVPQTANVETVVKIKGYVEDYVNSPEAAYPAADWLTEDGRVDFPAESLVLNPETTLSQRFARFAIPSEVLYKAETVDLLRMSAKWPMTSYDAYNFLCHYLDFLTNKFNGADELIDRPDLAEVVLREYSSDSFFPMAQLGDAGKQKLYDEKCDAQVDKIVLEEVLLASNRAFDQMDEDMKQATLEEALKKVEQRQSGRYSWNASGSTSFAEFPSGFFAYILEQQEAAGSKWYRYLVETGEAELVQKLDNLDVRDCWP